MVSRFAFSTCTALSSSSSSASRLRFSASSPARALNVSSSALTSSSSVTFDWAASFMSAVRRCELSLCVFRFSRTSFFSWEEGENRPHARPARAPTRLDALRLLRLDLADGLERLGVLGGGEDVVKLLLQHRALRQRPASNDVTHEEGRRARLRAHQFESSWCTNITFSRMAWAGAALRVSVRRCRAPSSAHTLDTPSSWGTSRLMSAQRLLSPSSCEGGVRRRLRCARATHPPHLPVLVANLDVLVQALELVLARRPLARELEGADDEERLARHSLALQLDLRLHVVRAVDLGAEGEGEGGRSSAARARGSPLGRAQKTCPRASWAATRR